MFFSFPSSFPFAILDKSFCGIKSHVFVQLSREKEKKSRVPIEKTNRIVGRGVTGEKVPNCASLFRCSFDALSFNRFAFHLLASAISFFVTLKKPIHLIVCDVTKKANASGIFEKIVNDFSSGCIAAVAVQ